MEAFKNLNTSDQQFLFQVPVLITFLVAGADNHIDYNEKQWAEKLLKFRSERNPNFILAKYYREVEKKWEENFEQNAAILIDQKVAEERSRSLVEMITKVNPLLPKLHPHTAKLLVDSWRSFAAQIAKASGGIWGWGSTSPEEYKWVKLEMIIVPNLIEIMPKIVEI
jgi:hypothetical protein